MSAAQRPYMSQCAELVAGVKSGEKDFYSGRLKLSNFAYGSPNHHQKLRVNNSMTTTREVSKQFCTHMVLVMMKEGV